MYRSIAAMISSISAFFSGHLIVLPTFLSPLAGARNPLQSRQQRRIIFEGLFQHPGVGHGVGVMCRALSDVPRQIENALGRAHLEKQGVAVAGRIGDIPHVSCHFYGQLHGCDDARSNRQTVSHDGSPVK